MQYFSIALLLAISLMAGATQVAASDNLCEGLFTGTERVAIPAVAKPPFMKYYKDPAFGSKVIRITDARVGEVFDPSTNGCNGDVWQGACVVVRNSSGQHRS